MAVTSSGAYVPAAHLAPLDWNETDYVAVAERFIGTPYLWGGKTALGLDCSALVQVAQKDSDVEVRIAACHALGSIGDTGAQGALSNIAANDPSSLVRDMAAIALLEL